MVPNRLVHMRFQGIIFRLFSSIYRRIHSWGIFTLLVLLYLSSAGLKSTLALYLFGRIGLMSVHVFSGFFLFIIFVLIAHNYLIKFFFSKNREELVHIQSQLGPDLVQGTGPRFFIDLAFYLVLLLICGLGLVYYFFKSYSIDFYLVNQTTISLSHTIAGWFFLSLAFVKYYLTFIHWFRDVLKYLREH
jgi:hypothetical protein